MRYVSAPLLGFVVLTLALLAFALALGWWWRTFEEVVRFGYLSWTDAGRCLLSDNDICSLAKALCLGSHPRNFYSYRSVASWAAIALLSTGFLLQASRPAAYGRRS